MKLSANFLSAFFEVAQTRHFGQAAERLAITPSALSQRISLLEDELSVTLFVRDRSGAHLTEAGELLLRYCQINSSLESEVLSQLRGQTESLAGVIRIGGFSSVLRSVIIPSMATFLRSHPKVVCEFRSYEVAELPDVLRRAEVDMVVLDYVLEKPSLVNEVLGLEEYVVIESAKHQSFDDIYLDHGPHDNATESYFASQAKKPNTYRRSFMGDVYGIINGVEFGLGRAVMSKHLLRGNSRIKLVRGFQKYQRKVALHYHRQPFYSKLQLAVASELTKNAPKYLGPSAD
jgi:DNA-binding transcriptional LysR family regulator